MTTTTALQALTNACDILEKTKVCSQVSEVFSSVDKALKLCNSAIAALSAAQDPPAEPDPHGTRYHCERAALALGHLSDDELANGAFMNYDQKLDIARALVNEPGYHPPIVWMTAVKDRIRWLSRQLAAARASQPTPAQDAAATVPACPGTCCDCGRGCAVAPQAAQVPAWQPMLTDDDLWTAQDEAAYQDYLARKQRRTAASAAPQALPAPSIKETPHA